MNDILQKVGLRIKEIRKSKAMTQDHLGDISNFHSTYIGGLERGERNISISNLQKLAEALDVKISEFFMFTPQLSSDEYVIGQIIELLRERNNQEIQMALSILQTIFQTYPEDRS